MEQEKAIEHAVEAIQEHAGGAHGDAASRRWITQVALSTLVMALLSALGALMAAISAHESLLERTQEVLDFVRLQNDRLEIEVLRAKHDLLRQSGVEPAASELSRIRAYETDLLRMTEQTTEEEAVVRTSAHAHLVFAIAVTLLSVGITLSGISMIARRRPLWIAGLAFGLAGTVSMAIALRDVF
jgi:hypothetical protein